jgi:predicted negative regulator of RcsB-dependent stress response
MDDDKNIKDKIKNEIKGEKKFIIRAVIVALLLIVGYYIFSPYQNCVRNGMSEFQCTRNTSW